MLPSPRPGLRAPLSAKLGNSAVARLRQRIQDTAVYQRTRGPLPEPTAAEVYELEQAVNREAQVQIDPNTSHSRIGQAYSQQVVRDCNLVLPPLQAPRQPAAAEHLVYFPGQEAKMKKYREEYDNGKMFGLIRAVWDTETSEEVKRPALKKMPFQSFSDSLLVVLAACDDQVLRHVIIGDLPRKYFAEHSVHPKIVSYYTRASDLAYIKMPMIYIRYLTDGYGMSPTLGEYSKMLNVGLEYCKRGVARSYEESVDPGYLAYIRRCVDIDNIIFDPDAQDPVKTRTKSRDAREKELQRRATEEANAARVESHQHSTARSYGRNPPPLRVPIAAMRTARSKKGLRRYLRTTISAKYEDNEFNSYSAQKKMIEYLERLKVWVEEEIKKHGPNARLARPQSYVGWALYFPSRLRDHETHASTNRNMAFFEALFLYCYRERIIDGFYQMRTFPTGMVSLEKSAGVAEVAFSVLADCYAVDLGGFAADDAGNSVASAGNLKPPAWGFIAHLAVTYTGLVKRIKDEAVWLDGLIKRHEEIHKARELVTLIEMWDKDPERRAFLEWARYQLAVANVVDEMLGRAISVLDEFHDEVMQDWDFEKRAIRSADADDGAVTPGEDTEMADV